VKYFSSLVPVFKLCNSSKHGLFDYIVDRAYDTGLPCCFGNVHCLYKEMKTTWLSIRI